MKCFKYYINYIFIFTLLSKYYIITGAVNHKQREIAWSKKRVIFATPQVFHNDLDKNVVPSDLVKCVVIDEAHKALGKHSYCEVSIPHNKVIIQK